MPRSLRRRTAVDVEVAVAVVVDVVVGLDVPRPALLEGRVIISGLISQGESQEY